eukprot:UN33972
MDQCVDDVEVCEDSNWYDCEDKPGFQSMCGCSCFGFDKRKDDNNYNYYYDHEDIEAINLADYGCYEEEDYGLYQYFQCTDDGTEMLYHVCVIANA